MEVRPATIEDVPRIAPWTRDTFDWGDYVADRIPVWLEEPESHTLVCAEGDEVIGLVNVVMLSPTEAWLEGARVHPEHRRRGIGSLMNQTGLDWAKEQGARVARLATEEGNAPARRQVESMGYRMVSTWAYAELNPLQRKPIAGASRLQPAPSADIDAAWMSWLSGDLSRAGREMTAIGWRWRTATPDDLREAVREQRFWQSPAGWVILGHTERTVAASGWLATTPYAAPDLLEDMAATGRETGLETIALRVPWTPWMVEALTRAGAEPEPVCIYAIGL
ncbi:MAG: GNAT family N-acetyltransferase [Actinomycetes bacterium]|jgi:GNAT superfamily N-acetyltransferase